MQAGLKGLIFDVTPNLDAKKHDVKVRAHSGATSGDLIDHINPVARRKPNLVVVHVGTNAGGDGKVPREAFERYSSKFCK